MNNTDFDLKHIWQAGTVKTANAYSESELQKIVVKSVRRSIMRLFPWVSGALLPVIFGYFIWKIIEGNQPAGVTILQIGIMFFVTVILVWATMVWKKRDRLLVDMPLKGWLKQQVDYMEEQVKFYKKYKYILPLSGSFIGVTIGTLYTYLNQPAAINWRTLLIIITITVAYIFISQVVLEKLRQKTYNELKKLYQELMEENIEE